MIWITREKLFGDLVQGPTCIFEDRMAGATTSIDNSIRDLSTWIRSIKVRIPRLLTRLLWNETQTPQLVIKNFEYILNELGRKQLDPLYPDDSTAYILSRSNNLVSQRNKFDVAGIEALQILGTRIG